MKTVLGALACVGLALLTARQAAVWHDSETLWHAARAQTPNEPRPWVNLAVFELARGGNLEALKLLDHAETLARQQSPFLRDWSLDVIDANRAKAAIAMGDLETARRLLHQPDALSAKQRVCAHFPDFCV